MLLLISFLYMISSICYSYSKQDKIQNNNMNNTTYKNPTIIEAIVEVRVIPKPELELHEIEEMHSKIQEVFPIKNVLANITGHINIKQGEAPEHSIEDSGPIGFLYKTSDNQKIIQATKEKFTFNLLGKYPGWKPFLSEAKSFWEIYSKIVRPVKITRVAIRYINSLKISLPVYNLSEYIKIYPKLPDEIPHTYEDFLLRFVIPEDKSGNIAVITEGLKKNPEPNTAELLFDMDIFKNLNNNYSYEELFELLDSLDTYKTEIFENTITDKYREMMS